MKVYVAGPDVFRPDAVEIAEKVKKLLASKGITALIPLDNDVDTTGKHPGEIAQEIYEKNVAMIDQADAVLANIEPFRGAHMDPGTAFEVGYAAAQKKPVYCFTSFAGETIYDRIKELDGEPIDFRDSEGNMVENFGETENLMITVPARGVFPTIEKALNSLVDDLVVPEDPGEEHA